jgi:hypothetical protein
MAISMREVEGIDDTLRSIDVDYHAMITGG